MSAAEKLLNTEQAAEQSGCSPRTIRRAIQDGELIASRLGKGPKSDRIHPLDLAAWWARRKTTVCQSPSVQTATIRLPSDTAEERIARRLGIGRTPTRKSTSGGTSPRSRTLKLVVNRKE